MGEGGSHPELQPVRGLARTRARGSDTLIRKVRRGELWNGAPAPRNRNDVPRRVVIDTLILGGLRISELCGLDGPHLDIASGRLCVPRSATKSDAGERDVPIVPALRQGLTEHRKEYPSGQGEPAFPTRNGTRQHPDNIRARILAPIRERANEQLEADGLLPIGHMTPHTLRRTFASMLAVCECPHAGRCTFAGARAIYNGEARAAEVDEKGLNGRTRPQGRLNRRGPLPSGGSRNKPEPSGQDSSNGRSSRA